MQDQNQFFSEQTPVLFIPETMQIMNFRHITLMLYQQITYAYHPGDRTP